MSHLYILKDGVPIEADSDEWARWYEANPYRTVCLSEVGEVKISTVFLGIDHNFRDGGSPILWETMIFGGEHDEYQERYTSAEDADEGHWRAVNLVKGKR